MAIGIYATLAFMLLRIRQGSEGISAIQDGGAVQVVDPLSGSVLSRSRPLAVRAMLLEADLLRAELQVDGVTVDTQDRAGRPLVPQQVDLLWNEPEEGTHRLAVRAYGTEGRLETSSVVMVTLVPTGTLVFASNRDGAYALYAMRTDGRDLTRLSSGPGDARQPILRGDGTMAFVAESASGQAVIHHVALDKDDDGKDLFPGRDPAWSSDGSRLAYASSVEGLSQVFVTDPANGNPLPLTSEAVYAGQPTWSPDGTHLAYVAEREDNLDIWIADLGMDEEPRRVTDDPATDWAPAWSPDGTWLAFVSNRGGSHQIYVMRVDGSDVQPLTDFPQGAESPTWSSAGYWLGFVAYTGEGTGVNAREIYIMRIDGGEIVRLTRNAHDDTEPDWSRMP